MRFITVASMPIHPATNTGSATSSYPSPTAGRSHATRPRVSSESPKTMVSAPGGRGSRGTRSDRRIPTASTGSATTNPASGPAMPMSNSARRVGIGERMRMTAPKVPMRGGPGRKWGQVAHTP